MSREDQKITRAKEQVFDAVRFLSPSEVHELFKDLASATEKLADEYDRKLGDLILS